MAEENISQEFRWNIEKYRSNKKLFTWKNKSKWIDE